MPLTTRLRLFMGTYVDYENYNHFVIFLKLISILHNFLLFRIIIIVMVI